MALVDLTATVVERFAYDAYGKALVLDPGYEDLSTSQYAWQYRHQGLRFDPTSNLHDNRARVYSAQLMRFLQRDPIEFQAGDPNVYRYVGNGPIGRMDPSGLQWGSVDSNWLPIKPGRGLSRIPTLGQLQRGLCQAIDGFRFKPSVTMLEDVSSGWIAQAAIKAAQPFFQNDSQKSELNAENANAMRHCVWQTLISLRYGLDAAVEIGNIHERYEDINVDSIVDRFNNQATRDIVVERVKASLREMKLRNNLTDDVIRDMLIDNNPNRDNIIKCVTRECKKAIDDGTLISDFNDIRLWRWRPKQLPKYPEKPII
jgi:RHS repeat-associated protein